MRTETRRLAKASEYGPRPLCKRGRLESDSAPDADEGVVDTDCDGLPDWRDTGDDTITTSREVFDGACFGDEVDGDSIVHWLDLDSDGHGNDDALEGYGDPTRRRQWPSSARRSRGYNSRWSSNLVRARTAGCS